MKSEIAVVAKTAAAKPSDAVAMPRTDHTTADASLRQKAIEETAYYRAQARDFAPGGELDDWLVAQAVVDGSAPSVRML